VCDISDVYESFVMKIVSELLVEGPNAPFYRTLIEADLGTGFSPSTGKALNISYINVQKSTDFKPQEMKERKKEF
jgi:Zn-dependent M16 (insulinase) family peptidase